MKNKTTLRDLIKNNHFKEVWEILLKFYPNQKKNKKGYQNTWKELNAIKRISKKQEYEITIIEHPSEDKKRKYYHINGRRLHNKSKTYALDYSTFTEWVSFKISDFYTKKFTQLEIIAHCLWEMTFHGFSNKQILRRRKKVFGILKNVKRNRKEKAIK